MGILDFLFSRKKTTKILHLIETFEKPRLVAKDLQNEIIEGEGDYYAAMKDGRMERNIEKSLKTVKIYDSYEIRISEGSKVPPSLTDTLIYDICNINEDNDDEFKTKMTTAKIKNLYAHITLENIHFAINIYLNSPPDKIPGLRPKAHSRFIKQFNQDELELLAEEVLQYIHNYGVVFTFPPEERPLNI